MTVLREATERVRDPHPLHAPMGVWTFVTFSLPEDLRSLRSRLRSTLTWEGFAPLRDGLWVAPGEIDLSAALEAMRADLPAGAILAFHGRELPEFPMADSARSAWDIEAIRAEHLAFIDAWTTGAEDSPERTGHAHDARRGLARLCCVPIPGCPANSSTTTGPPIAP